MIGIVAAPACSGVYPSGPCRTRPRRKNTTPSAPYSRSVTTLVPLNVARPEQRQRHERCAVRRSTTHERDEHDDADDRRASHAPR